MQIEDFIKEIISGPTGFKTWEDREFIVHTNRDEAIAAFVIRCLANPRCENSNNVLEKIEARRNELLSTEK